jgi:predicted dehydrogenase
MKKLRVGIIGLGVGEKHIHAYEIHPDCEVVLLCDFAEEKLLMAREKYPGIRLTKDAAEVINAPEINIVSIASFDDYHFDQVNSSILNKKHVFVEKPLCRFREEAVQIKDLLNIRPDVKLSSNLNLRTAPRFKRLRDWIRKGEMGRIYYIEADYLWGRLHKLTDGWRREMDYYSIINGAAVHMIDLLLWLTGKCPVEVKGYGNQIATSGSGFRFDDFAVMLLRFEDGMIAKITANAGCIHPHFHRVVIYGTEQTFINDVSGGKLVSARDSNHVFADISEEYLY